MFTANQLKVVKKKHLLSDPGLSETVIAERCGVSRATVSRVRAQLSIPRPKSHAGGVTSPRAQTPFAPVRGTYVYAYAERTKDDGTATWMFRTAKLKHLRRFKGTREQALALVHKFDTHWAERYGDKQPVVGIVGKAEYAKTIIQRLSGSSKINVLTFGPDSYSEPNKADIIVVRPGSVGHRAFWDVKNTIKNHPEKVYIFSDSAKKIVDMVRGAIIGENASYLTDDLKEATTEGESPTNPVDSAAKRSPAECFIVDCIESLGIVIQPLRNESALASFVDWVKFGSQEVKLPAKPPGMRTPIALGDEATTFTSAELFRAFNKVMASAEYPCVQIKVGGKKKNKAEATLTFLTYSGFSESAVQVLRDKLDSLYKATGSRPLWMSSATVMPAAAPPVVEVVAEPAAPSVEEAAPQPSFQQDVEDALMLVREVLETHSYESVPAKYIEAVGLTGSLVLPLVHLSTPEGHVACASESAATDSMILADVSCPKCKNSEQFKLLSWYEDRKAAN